LNPTELFLWSEDSGDSVGASVGESEAIYDQIANTYPQPHIVLNHETYDTTAYQVLPYAVSKLQSKGYQLVAVDTCMGDEGEWPYQYVGEPQQRDSSWVC
jgi:peptidoglycan/xylan/chitin deacetylase (PgdA/CDA1 family)